jgi:hypothetical protein
MPETLLSGIESGLRFTRHSPPMRALIVHNISFALCASIVLALLPVIARDQLQLGAGGFGLLSASFGIGAVVSALLVPRGLHRAPLNAVVTAFVLIWIRRRACSSPPASIASSRSPERFCTGAAWTGVFSSLSAGTQTSGAGVGACPVGRDEPHRGAGGDGRRQRVLGVARGVDRPAHGDGAAAGTMLLLLGDQSARAGENGRRSRRDPEHAPA